MGKELTNTKTFEQRMMDRIKKDIGKLITDKELKSIVKKGVQKAFFEGREKTEGYNTYTDEAWVVKGLREILNKKVNEFVEQELSEKKEELLKITKEVIEKGLGMAIVNAISNMFSQNIENFKYDISNTIANMNH